jgi:Uma2 family endonuclease
MKAMLAERIAQHDETPVDDHIVLFHDATAVEPDECYVFGNENDPQRPDLAIEVIWTSGRLDKRDIYRALGVRELWFWRKGRLTAHLLRGDGYEEISASEVLPGIDLVQLMSFLDRPTMSQAIREYGEALGGR